MLMISFIFIFSTVYDFSLSPPTLLGLRSIGSELFFVNENDYINSEIKSNLVLIAG